MRVLIDSRGFQAQAHLEDGRRLGVFISTLEQIAGCSMTFSTGSPLTGSELRDCDVLVVTTRYPKEYAYSQAERTAVRDFVGEGGGLLLMSNHGDLPGHNPHNMTRYDAIMAREFGVELECTWFQNPSIGELWTFLSNTLLAGHPILAGGQNEEAVQTIVTNNCSSIVLGGRGHALVTLSPEMRDLRNEYTPADRLFAHALDAETDAGVVGKGRVVTVADSGFIGNEDTEPPGNTVDRHCSGLPTWGIAVMWDRHKAIQDERDTHTPAKGAYLSLAGGSPTMADQPTAQALARTRQLSRE